MVEFTSAVEDHMKQMAVLMQQLTSQFYSGLRSAYDSFVDFFHAVDWKEPWLQGLMTFHVILLLVILYSRKNADFQMCLFLLAMAGIYFAESINVIFSSHWKSFANQNYFDSQGVFLATLWSGPLLMNASVILIITLVSLLIQMVKCKQAELRHRTRLAHDKQD